MAKPYKDDLDGSSTLKSVTLLTLTCASSYAGKLMSPLIIFCQSLFVSYKPSTSFSFGLSLTSVD